MSILKKAMGMLYGRIAWGAGRTVKTNDKNKKGPTSNPISNLCYKALYCNERLQLEDLQFLKDLGPADESYDYILNFLLINNKKLLVKAISRFFDIDETITTVLLKNYKRTIDRNLSTFFEKGSVPLRFDTLLKKLRKLSRAMNSLHTIFRQVSDFVPNKGTYLDVGCGNGLSVAVAIKHNYKHVRGVEPDYAGRLDLYSAIEKAINLKNSCEAKIITTDFLDFDEVTTFDFITCLDVTEHVSKPEEIVRQLTRKCKNTGLIYLYQHNPTSFQTLMAEPHYQLPFLTLLPRDMVISILQKQGKPVTHENFVVKNWLSPAVFNEFFGKYGYTPYLIDTNYDFLTGAKYLQCNNSNISKYFEDIHNLLRGNLYGFLNASEEKTVERIFNDYKDSVREATNADLKMAEILFFRRTWFFICIKKGTLIEKTITEKMSRITPLIIPKDYRTFSSPWILN